MDKNVEQEQEGSYPERDATKVNDDVAAPTFYHKTLCMLQTYRLLSGNEATLTESSLSNGDKHTQAKLRNSRIS
jgi:hypothetical protein